MIRPNERHLLPSLVGSRIRKEASIPERSRRSKSIYPKWLAPEYDQVEQYTLETLLGRNAACVKLIEKRPRLDEKCFKNWRIELRKLYVETIEDLKFKYISF